MGFLNPFSSCAHCKSWMLWDFVTHEGHRYCNAQCVQEAQTESVAKSISPEHVDQYTEMMHQGACPLCGGSGPVDVHRSYSVWSFLIATSYRTVTKICCRKCALKQQASHLFQCLLFGWWGIPWGILLTPIYIVRNIWAMLFPPPALGPSAKLREVARFELATNLRLSGLNQAEEQPAR